MRHPEGVSAGSEGGRDPPAGPPRGESTNTSTWACLTKPPRRFGCTSTACRARGPDAGCSLRGWLRSARDAPCPPLRSSMHGHGPVLGLRQAGRYHRDTVPPAACMMHGRVCQHSCEPIQHTAWAVAADQWYVGPTDVLRGPAIKEQPESIAMRPSGQQPPHWLSAPGSE